MKLRTLLSCAVTTAFFTTTSFAIELAKPIPANVVIKTQTSTQAAVTKTVYLMNIKLTPSEQQQFSTFNPLNSNSILNSSKLPSQVDVGMNNTPVLDQGIHGSCVTFANTAAVDALLRKGDYVSQLCALNLGQYLEDHSYYMSGWDGSWGETVLNQLIQFGIVNTNAQKTNTCGGLSEYPVKSFDRGHSMSLDEYHTLSENIKTNIVYRPFMTLTDRLHWGNRIETNSAAILERVKEALANKPDPNDPNSAGLVTFGVLLPLGYCSVGACGSYHATYDTWALTNAIKHNPSSLGGHEMIITGYDDNAIVVDNEGKKHQGLLTLRNSWGSDVGDKGNYYMTYEFFRKFVIEAQQVVWLSSN